MCDSLVFLYSDVLATSAFGMKYFFDIDIIILNFLLHL